MRIKVAAFTDRGRALAKSVFDHMDMDTVIYRQKEDLKEWTREAFEQRSALVFVGAAGIAVRAIAPFVSNKLSDSPVIVMDETGSYVIPILSGHVGGANELAIQIAKITGAVPVITTATDINGVFAVDIFARNNALEIVNRERIAGVSAKLLRGETITIALEGWNGQPQKEGPDWYELLEKRAADQWGNSVKIIKNTSDSVKDVLISHQRSHKDCVQQAELHLVPREYTLGIGCRRGKTCAELESYVRKICGEQGIRFPQDIAVIASVDRKKEEPGIVELACRAGLGYVTFSAEELRALPGEFSASGFVREQVGVDNVCERAAVAAALAGHVRESRERMPEREKEEAVQMQEIHRMLVVRKQAANGITLAIARREWRDLRF